MEEDTEFKKLPIDERCVHKLWKARVDGYEEAAKIFREIVDEKSPEWNKFVGLIRKFVNDSNALAQEKGLEATLVFAENCGHAGKTVGDVMSGIVLKCIAAPKTKTKDLSVQVALMYVEIEKQEAVIEELLKGMEHKNPKIVAACITTATLALHEFGSKVIGVKPLIKKIPSLLSDRDKAVREEGKLMTIEIYRWIGAALKPQLASLTPVIITELESEFEKIKVGKAEPNRYIKSQQAKQTAMAANVVQGESVDNADEMMDDEAAEIDPLDFADPVEILSKLPKDFYDKIEAKKWQERKEALDALEALLQSPKLEPGEYGELVKVLKRVLTKDSNVVLVAMAGKCIAGLAKGLGKKFQPYVGACVPAVLEKFKEKKTNVVTALRDAIDAMYPATNLEAIQEDILEALNNKNPSVKSETASFLARAFSRTQPNVLSKKMLKTYITSLLKTLNEPDLIVRDCSAEAIGTCMKLVGEKAMPFLSEVDNLKMAKIKECCDRAVIVVKISAPKKPAPAPVKAAVARGGSTDPKPVTRPVMSGTITKKPALKKPTASSGSALIKCASTTKVPQTERELSSDEVDMKAGEILPSDILSGMIDANWKTRLDAVESLNTTIGSFDRSCGHSQVLLRTIIRKPGLKDTNFQVLKVKLDAIKSVVQNIGVTVTSSDLFINEVTEKLADIKNNTLAAEVLSALAEAISLEYVATNVTTYAFEQKSPKLQQEALVWVSGAIKEFGFHVNLKALIGDVKKSLQSTNAAVRTASISLLGTMYLHTGQSLMSHFDLEKPALRQLIQMEFDKYGDQCAPDIQKSASITDEMENSDGDQAINTVQEITRVDISSKITEALLVEIEDKNWKTRNEGLVKLQGILNDAKLIKPSLGDLPLALARRLVDSNAKIGQTALAICQQLAESMGPSCRQYVRVFFPGFLHGLSDNKAFIRLACISCINVWGDQCGYKEFFEGEMIADALKSGSPSLKTEVWGWLAEKLPGIPPKSISKDELHSCLPYLYANICDRSAEVRKNANEAILGIMIHIGYDAMIKALDKQKPSSKKDIQAALDKARPNLPVKPLPKSKQQAPIIEESKLAKPGRAVSAKSNKATVAPAKNVGAPSSRKKEDDVDLSPLLATNNTKNQRLIDEQKLRVLKWTFTQPREEFTDLLRDQMVSANVNKGLMANMFHEDFRYHLKVIDALIEDLPSNDQALISNLDLILKWLSLRFYDTNPSVLLKGLDYLNLVFQMLIENEYFLAENEGSSFIPHLLIKIGDPKDTVRNGVRTLLRQICLVYPFAKVFIYIMDGLKSKNARQRTECLDELGYLIETYGLSVCQPTPQTALKEIAKHISDRDNSVRNAALNAIVQAYFLSGEKVYKLIGQLSDKELSMLDERIKRAKKTRRPDTNNIVKVASATNVVMPEHSADNNDVNESSPEEELQQPEEVSPVALRQQFEQHFNQKPLTGPFRLDPDVIADIEKNWVRSDQMEQKPIPKVDLSFMNSPIKIVERDGFSYPSDKLQKLISNPPSIPAHSAYSSNYTMSPPQPSAAVYAARAAESLNLANALPKLDPNLVRIIRGIGSTDSLNARASINELNDILDNPEKQAVLRDYEELYIESVLTQFKYLAQSPSSESMVMYQPLLATTFSYFNSKSLGKNLAIPNLKNIISVLLGLMADHKLSIGDDGQYTKVINGICLKILNRSNFSNLNCALIRLLKESCSSTGLPKFTDLLMKCIWRNVKVMPERAQELDYDAVLLEVHEFMVALPGTWWHKRPSDTPLRTVKTIIHNMAKYKGNGILQHLNKIPTHSELHAYLIRMLKNFQKDASGAVTPVPPEMQHVSQVKDNTKRMSKASHDAISYIFKLISNKETSREGLEKLYEFKIKNPDVDVVPFLKGASPHFQKYIDDSLAEIEQKYNYQNTMGQGANDSNKSPIETVPNRLTSNAVNVADMWMEKLHDLMMKSNTQTTRSDDLESLDNKMAEEYVSLLASKNPLIKKEVHHESISTNRMELLQQKLAQIRKPK